ncbi:hypothetical protein [Streptomyces sp. NPDC006879]|uniref:hypothetical protein n=1 Tax=Streptomyces sp. NPDC006879 TaxID=3364767 RepID=UPI0036AB6E68
MRTTPHHRAALAACAILVPLAVAGCSTPSGPRPSHPSPSEPAPHPTSPEETCFRLISYWAKEAIRGSKWAGLDWEQKGLSNQQYEIHEVILADARAEERTHGRSKALELIDREADRQCTLTRGATRSSENWRPPQ